MGGSGVCCRACMSNAVLGTCASLYVIIGVAIAATAGAAFFTPLGQIITPVYAACTMGGGIAIFIIGCIGLCAACDSQQRVCLLHLFTLLTLSMVVLSVVLAIIMFEYEAMLEAASAAGGEVIKDDVAEGVADATVAVSASSADVIRTMATNAFYACGATVNATEETARYTFRCSNSKDFGILAESINATCMNPDVAVALNASAGSVFHKCYAGSSFPSWSGHDETGRAVSLSAATLLAALNTPKGLFCACSSTLIDAWILPYLGWAKYIAMCVCACFLLVLLACVHQICRRGCCGGKGRKEVERQPELSSIQMTYPDANAGKKKGKGASSKMNDGGYIARP